MLFYVARDHCLSEGESNCSYREKRHTGHKASLGHRLHLRPQVEPESKREEGFLWVDDSLLSIPGQC